MPKTKIEDWGAYIHKLYVDIQAYRMPIHSVWWTNLAWLYGNQWTAFNESLRKYDNYIGIIRDKRIRLTINIIRTIMGARWSFIVGDEPSIFVDPAGDETEDRLKAYMAQRIARADWEENDLFRKCMAAIEWVKSCGEGYTLTYYDRFEKKVKQRTISPLQTAIDPMASEPDEWRHFTIGSLVSREEFESIHPDLDVPDYAPGETATGIPNSIQEMFMTLKNPNIMSLLDIPDSHGKHRNLFVLEYYERPSQEHEKGMYRLVVNKKQVKEMPLDVGEIPIVGFYDSMQAGVLDHHTPVTEIRTLQEELNRTASLDLERIQQPDYISFPRGCGWPRHFGSRALEIGYHTPMSGEPKFVSGASQRFDYMQRMQYLEEKAENLAGVNSLQSRGDPKYQMSGRMGYVIRDANRSLLGFISNQYKHSVQKMERLRLLYMKKYYTTERIASFTNEYDRGEITRFTGVKDIGNNLKVRVILNASMENPSSRAQRVLEFGQNPLNLQQLVKNPLAYKKYVEEVSPEIAHALFISETDIAVAQDENLIFSKGGNPPLHWWDEDQVHLDEHFRVLKSDWIKTWTENAVLLLEDHCKQHEQQKTSKMYKAAYEQMQAQLNMKKAQEQMMMGSLPNDNVEGVVRDVDRPLEAQTEQTFPTQGGSMGGVPPMPPLPPMGGA